MPLGDLTFIGRNQTTFGVRPLVRQHHAITSSLHIHQRKTSFALAKRILRSATAGCLILLGYHLSFQRQVVRRGFNMGDSRPILRVIFFFAHHRRSAFQRNRCHLSNVDPVGLRVHQHVGQRQADLVGASMVCLRFRLSQLADERRLASPTSLWTSGRGRLSVPTPDVNTQASPAIDW